MNTHILISNPVIIKYKTKTRTKHEPNIDIATRSSIVNPMSILVSKRDGSKLVAVFSSIYGNP